MTRSITGSAWSSRKSIMVDFTVSDGGYEYTRRSNVPVILDIKDAISAMANAEAIRDPKVFWARSPFTVSVRHANDYLPGHYVFTLYTED